MLLTAVFHHNFTLICKSLKELLIELDRDISMLSI